MDRKTYFKLVSHAIYVRVISWSYLEKKSISKSMAVAFYLFKHKKICYMDKKLCTFY